MTIVGHSWGQWISRVVGMPKGVVGKICPPPPDFNRVNRLFNSLSLSYLLWPLLGTAEASGSVGSSECQKGLWAKSAPPPLISIGLTGYSIASLSLIYYDHCWAQLRPVEQQGCWIAKRGCGQNLPSPLIRIGFVDIDRLQSKISSYLSFFNFWVIQTWNT